MDFDYTPTQKDIRKEVSSFCKTELNEGIDACDRDGQFPREPFEKIGAELKLQGLAVPEALGGRGLDPLTTITVLEAFGHACEDAGLVHSVCAQLLACCVPIHRFASDDQQKSVLPDLCAAKKIGVDAIADPDSTGITATADGDDYILNGTIPQVTNGPVGDYGTFTAITDSAADTPESCTTFLIDLALPGITLGESLDQLGKRTAPVGEVRFEDVRVPAAAILGGQLGNGAEVYSHAINWLRIGQFAAHVGTMRRLTESATKRARKLKQAGGPASEIQASAQKVVDMKVRLETARLLTYSAASRLDKAGELALDASVTKLFVGDALLETARGHLQIHGDEGLINATGATRPLRDAIGSTSDSGSPESQRAVIAEQLGL